jgi:thiol-disulfide isomerase/thioredoxin
MCKNKYRFLLIIVTVLIIALLVFYLNSSKKEQYSGMTLPEISAFTFDGNLFELDKLDKVKKTVVFFFSPDCDNCEDEIKEIITHKTLFEDKDIRWIFITMDIFKDELSVFLKSYPINTMSNAFVILDRRLYYHHLFEVPGAPVVFLFDKSERLSYKIVGGFNVNTIVQWLEDTKTGGTQKKHL